MMKSPKRKNVPKKLKIKSTINIRLSQRRTPMRSSPDVLKRARLSTMQWKHWSTPTRRKSHASKRKQVLSPTRV